MAEVQYATNGKGNLGVTLGAIGTGLGALAGAGGLGALLGLNQQQNSDPNEKPVSRYEMSLIRESMAKDTEIAALKSQIYTDNKIAGVQAEISAQAVWNATQEGILRCQQERLAQLFSMTRLTIPNANVSPGWGPVDVYPVPATATTAASGSGNA